MKFDIGRIWGGDSIRPAAGAAVSGGFAPFPAALQDGLTEEQREWQRQVYERAYTEALRTVAYQPVESYQPLLAGMGAFWRN